MKILKKLASFILQEEIIEQQKQYKLLKIEKLEAEKKALEKMTEDLKKIAFGDRKVLFSQEAAKYLVQILPDPNKLATGTITFEELKKRNLSIAEEMEKAKCDFHIYIGKIVYDDDKVVQGVTIRISSYDHVEDVFIPVRREKMSYEIHGIETTIDTYFWDIYRSGIRIMSNESWELFMDFIKAQKDVLKEFC